jgi:hypothetical protein
MIGFKHKAISNVAAAAIMVLVMTGVASAQENQSASVPASAHCHCVDSGTLLCGTEIIPGKHQVFALTDVVILSDENTVIHLDDNTTTRVAFISPAGSSPTLAESFRTPFIFSTNLTVICESNFDATTEVTVDGLLVTQPH